MLESRLARRVAPAASLLALSACTSILGIDGTYVGAAPEGAARHRAEAGPSAGGDGSGGDGSGGDGPESGGGPGAGGTTDGSGGTATIDAGCTSCKPPPANCRPGLYQGKFNGNHNASVAVGFGNLPIVNGDISFRLGGGASPLSITSGTVKGTFAWGSFDATLAGTYECDTGALVGHLHGALNVLPLRPTIDGTVLGELLGDASTRTWAEQESGAPASGTLGKGSGTWSASFVKP